MWQPCLSERRGLHPWACQRSEGSPSPQPVPAESPFPTRHRQANVPLLGKMLGAEAGRSAPSQGGAGEALGFSLFWRSCWLGQPGPSSCPLSGAARGGGRGKPGRPREGLPLGKTGAEAQLWQQGGHRVPVGPLPAGSSSALDSCGLGLGRGAAPASPHLRPLRLCPLDACRSSLLQGHQRAQASVPEGAMLCAVPSPLPR